MIICNLSKKILYQRFSGKIGDTALARWLFFFYADAETTHSVQKVVETLYCGMHLV